MFLIVSQLSQREPVTMGWNKSSVKLLNLMEMKWSGRVDLNHRPPGPEPASKKSLSHRPGVTYGIWNDQKSPSDSQPFATSNDKSGEQF
jgi:hypothetical protein